MHCCMQPSCCVLVYYMYVYIAHCGHVISVSHVHVAIENANLIIAGMLTPAL